MMLDCPFKTSRSTAPASAAAKPDVAALPVLGSTPMAPGIVDKAQKVLAEHIGPIASVLVRRAAAQAGSREVFFTELADQAGGDADRKLLLAQLWRIE